LERPELKAVMAKTVFILLLLSAFFIGTAEAGQKVLAVQSIPVAPYEQAIKGFEQVYGSEVKRFFISKSNERTVQRTIREIRPDIILAVGRDALSSVRRIRDVPVVYCMVLNPHSLLSGEKNISGVSMNLPPERQLSELLHVLPAVHSIGLLYDPDQSGAFVQGIREAAARMGVTLTAAAVHRARDIPPLLNAMKGKADLFWMLPDITVVTPETVESILLFSLENNVPILTFSEKYLELGAMLSIGIDPFDIGRQAGEMAQRIFSGNAAGDVQHIDARKALISVNSKIAEKIGVTIDREGMKNIRVVK
jgi:putative tryptophan/tyrosine transport system substrate-binding protein